MEARSESIGGFYKDTNERGYEESERIGVVQLAKEKILGKHHCSLPVLEGVYRKNGEGLFVSGSSNRKRGCKQKEGNFKLVARKKYFT